MNPSVIFSISQLVVLSLKTLKKCLKDLEKISHWKSWNQRISMCHSTNIQLSKCWRFISKRLFCPCVFCCQVIFLWRPRASVVLKVAWPQLWPEPLKMATGSTCHHLLRLSEWTLILSLSWDRQMMLTSRKCGWTFP